MRQSRVRLGLVNTAGSLIASFTYSPYGETRATRCGTGTISNPWRSTGGYYDTTTGLYKFEARYYDPTLGRFTQPDPSGQEANDYLYATADPCNSTGPTGLSTLGCVGGVLQMVGGLGGIAAAVIGEVGSGGIGTLAAVGIAALGVGLIGSGLSPIDSCSS